MILLQLLSIYIGPKTETFFKTGSQTAVLLQFHEHVSKIYFAFKSIEIQDIRSLVTVTCKSIA